MSDTLTTVDAFEPLFDELWLALGPKERTDYAEKLRVYHRHLRDLRVDALRIGITRTIQGARLKVLPSVGEIRAHALEHAAGMQRAMRHVRSEAPDVPHTHCACRCGGRRWHKVLRDPATAAVRTYPADTARGALVPEHLRTPRFTALLEGLAGQPMLRTFVACRKAGVDPEPAHEHYLGLDADGCPVYDPDRRAAAQQEAA